MPKLKRSNEQLSFAEIKRIFEERNESLKSFCVWGNAFFIGLSQNELEHHLTYHLREAEYDACLSLLGAIEAAFRLDFDSRYSKRLKDPRSKAVRRMAKEAKDVFHFRIPISELFDLLAIDHSVPDRVINVLKIYFKYRHWLAHGRYWQLQKGKPKPTFSDIFQVAQTIKNVLQN